MFKQATREQVRLRLLLTGISGSGKTWTALEIAHSLGQNIGVIDTENGSASRYVGQFQFQSCPLGNSMSVGVNPLDYVKAMDAATRAGFDVLIIDSLSHYWLWALDLVGGFGDWKKVRPPERQLINAMLNLPCHLIATARSKAEYVVVDAPNKRGKLTSQPQRVGTAPLLGQDLDYEFDVVGAMDTDHVLTIEKSRCPNLGGQRIAFPGQAFAQELLRWTQTGAPATESYEQKCNRIRDAREKVGRTSENVIALMKQHFQVESPHQLSSGQCDQLIELINRPGENVQPSTSASVQPVQAVALN